MYNKGKYWNSYKVYINYISICINYIVLYHLNYV